MIPATSFFYLCLKRINFWLNVKSFFAVSLNIFNLTKSAKLFFANATHLEYGDKWAFLICFADFDWFELG